MPYRRLPNTDAARLRALRIAKQKYDEKGMAGVPYSSKIIYEVDAFIPMLERAISDYKMSLGGQVEQNQKYQTLVRTARMYVSHFIQVLNLSCLRNEIKPEKKLLYKLLPDNYAVPDLSTEMLLKEWGQNIIEGQYKRLNTGGTPIYNPAIAKVKVHYDLFMDAYQSKRITQQNSNRYLDHIQKLRSQADELILALWNQIENAYSDLGMLEMQSRAKEFGIVYYLRRKERQALGASVSNADEAFAEDL